MRRLLHPQQIAYYRGQLDPGVLQQGFQLAMQAHPVPHQLLLAAGQCPPQALFRTKVPNLNVFINWYAAAPDGQRFVINTTGGTGSVQPITVLVNWETRLNP